jgi:hypothetical protein
MSGIASALRNVNTRAHEPEIPVTVPENGPVMLGTGDGFVALARQVFFSSSGISRRRVLFVAADRETQIGAIGERVARAAASMRVTVALVDSGSSADNRVPVKKPAAGTRGAAPRPELQIAERLWRISLDTLLDSESASARSGPEFVDPFGCVLFTAVISDGVVPQICELCDAAILAVTAGHTRRDVAVRAKQLLEQLNVNLLGTVIAEPGRPIPDPIYQRI